MGFRVAVVPKRGYDPNRRPNLGSIRVIPCGTIREALGAVLDAGGGGEDD